MSPLTPLPPDPPDIKDKLLNTIKQHLMQGRFTEYAPSLEAVYLLLQYLCTLSYDDLRKEIPVHEKTYPNDLSFGAIWITIGKAKWGSASAFKMGGGGTPCSTKYGDMKKWASSNVDGIVIREFRLPGNDDLRLKFVDRATRNKRKRKSITKALVLASSTDSNDISIPLQLTAPDSPSILVRSIRPRPSPSTASRFAASANGDNEAGVNFMALPALTMSLPQELRANPGPVRVSLPFSSGNNTQLLSIKMEPVETPENHASATTERADVMAAFELVRLSNSSATP